MNQLMKKNQKPPLRRKSLRNGGEIILRIFHGSTPVCHSENALTRQYVREYCNRADTETCRRTSSSHLRDEGRIRLCAVQGTLAADDVPSLNAVRGDYLSL